MPGFQGFCFAKQGYSASKMHIGILLRKGRKIYEGFKRICSVLILSDANPGVSFLMGSTCKAAYIGYSCNTKVSGIAHTYS